MDTSKKKTILIMILCAAAVVGLTYSARLFSGKWVSWVVYLAIGCVGLLAAWISGQNLKEVFVQKHPSQIIYAVLIAAILCLAFGILPILCGTSLIGTHEPFSAGRLLYQFAFLLFAVGVVEEFVFRVFFQNAFLTLLPKAKWLAPLFAGVLFGAWHLVNGGVFQFLLTSLIGSYIGYVKYFSPRCTFYSVAAGHGFYDFSLVLLRMFAL